MGSCVDLTTAFGEILAGVIGAGAFLAGVLVGAATMTFGAVVGRAG